MGSPLRYCIIAPDDADVAAIQTALGVTFVAAVYQAADAPTRPEWGKWLGIAFTTAQQAAIENTGGLRDSYPSSTFQEYTLATNTTIPQNQPFNSLTFLNGLGLTNTAT